jgi:hypothetical protein
LSIYGGSTTTARSSSMFLDRYFLHHLFFFPNSNELRIKIQMFKYLMHILINYKFRWELMAPHTTMSAPEWRHPCRLNLNRSQIKEGTNWIRIFYNCLSKLDIISAGDCKRLFIKLTWPDKWLCNPIFIWSSGSQKLFLTITYSNSLKFKQKVADDLNPKKILIY